MAKIELLGSGGAFSPLETAYLVNDSILIDCGSSVVKRLIQQGRAKDITSVFITHVHQDHCNGIEALIYYRRHVVRKPDEQLTIMCTSEVADYIATLACSHVEDFEVLVFDTAAISMEWETDEGYGVVIDGLDFTPVKTLHNRGELQSFGLVIENQDNRIAITGDVDNVVGIRASGFLVVFHDAGWTGIPDMSDRVHPFASEVAKLGENVLCVHTDADVTKDGARAAHVGAVIEF